MVEAPRYILDGQKLAWHRERVDAWLRGERIAPITIDMALTRACNFGCVYCYGRLQENERRPLTLDVLEGFLDDAAAIGVKAISLVSDGESTCHRDYAAFIRYGRRAGLDMALGTNGFLLDAEKLESVLADLTYLRFNVSAGEPSRFAEIHGTTEAAFERVCGNIRAAVAIKRRDMLPVTIGMQMVLMPELADQIEPVALLGRELGVDYVVIKHCSDDERGSLGVDYAKYDGLTEALRRVEALSTPGYAVRAKWSKILSGGRRRYTQCFGPPFIIQLSGSGLVAPCGMLFGEAYRRFHIGNIAETRFIDLWRGARYWEVMEAIRSPGFNPQTDCGTLCLQHKVNEFLWDLRGGHARLPVEPGPVPAHVNFV